LPIIDTQRSFFFTHNGDFLNLLVLDWGNLHKHRSLHSRNSIPVVLLLNSFIKSFLSYIFYNFHLDMLFCNRFRKTILWTRGDGGEGRRLDDAFTTLDYALVRCSKDELHLAAGPSSILPEASVPGSHSIIARSSLASFVEYTKSNIEANEHGHASDSNLI